MDLRCNRHTAANAVRADATVTADEVLCYVPFDFLSAVAIGSVMISGQLILCRLIHLMKSLRSWLRWALKGYLLTAFLQFVMLVHVGVQETHSRFEVKNG